MDELNPVPLERIFRKQIFDVEESENAKIEAPSDIKSGLQCHLRIFAGEQANARYDQVRAEQDEIVFRTSAVEAKDLSRKRHFGKQRIQATEPEIPVDRREQVRPTVNRFQALRICVRWLKWQHACDAKWFALAYA